MQATRLCLGPSLLMLHVLSCCVSMRSRVRSGRALSCPRVLLCFVLHMICVRPRAFSLPCVVAHSLGFPGPRAFMFCLNTQLMTKTHACVFVSCDNWYESTWHKENKDKSHVSCKALIFSNLFQTSSITWCCHFDTSIGTVCDTIVL